MEIQFAQGITFQLPSIRVFEYPEPIFLIGTDILAASRRTRLTYAYHGVNPVSKVGEILFHGERGLEAVELSGWPVSSRVAVPKKLRFAERGSQEKLALSARGRRL